MYRHFAYYIPIKYHSVAHEINQESVRIQRFRLVVIGVVEPQALSLPVIDYICLQLLTVYINRFDDDFVILSLKDRYKRLYAFFYFVFNIPPELSGSHRDI